jgi:hypothetical protein
MSITTNALREVKTIIHTSDETEYAQACMKRARGCSIHHNEAALIEHSLMINAKNVRIDVRRVLYGNHRLRSDEAIERVGHTYFTVGGVLKYNTYNYRQVYLGENYGKAAHTTISRRVFMGNSICIIPV